MLGKIVENLAEKIKKREVWSDNLQENLDNALMGLPSDEKPSKHAVDYASSYLMSCCIHMEYSI